MKEEISSPPIYNILASELFQAYFMDIKMWELWSSSLKSTPELPRLIGGVLELMLEYTTPVLYLTQQFIS